MMPVSVCLSVTTVHWRIIANLGFKFRSKFTARAHVRARGKGSSPGRVEGSSRVMLTTAGPSCYFTVMLISWATFWRISGDNFRDDVATLLVYCAVLNSSTHRPFRLTSYSLRGRSTEMCSHIDLQTHVRWLRGSVDRTSVYGR